MNSDELAKKLHKELKGKITISLRDSGELTPEKLAAYYTPGVGAISRLIAEDPAKLPIYTWTNNLVAVISDGSSVLGLGDIGPKAAMPVMEGKAMLFKHFAGIDSVPIILNAHTADEIISAVEAIAPSFGAINLEDIAAPVCFEVEAWLKQSLEIPVMHDDQHGTATVVLAGLINAMKLTKRKFESSKIVILGAGAAGVAIAKLLELYARPHVLAVDSKGIISASRTDLNESKKLLLAHTNPDNLGGSLADGVAGADVIIGVSRAGLITPEMVRSMHKYPIIFALANPTPEIMPDLAISAGAAVVATGRSDFPNQVNNALAFPGIFRGALDHKVRQITDKHKLDAAIAIADLIAKPDATHIIPSVFDERLVPAVSAVIT
ncbi:MAG: NADP-dependent malic enzyme [Candidatus Saccharimonadia bacterium]